MKFKFAAWAFFSAEILKTKLNKSGTTVDIN